MKLTRRLFTVVVVSAFFCELALLGPLVQAQDPTFVGWNLTASLSASATFAVLSNSLLQVTLVNTYPGDTPDQSHVLTALFFSGADGLTPVSVTAGAGSVQWVGGTSSAPPGPSVLGEEWEYATGPGNPGGASDGIASAGLDNNFGHGNFASPGDALDGSSYGILSTGYAGSQGDGIDGRLFIQNTIVFVLSNFTGNVGSISNVSFQYGTGLSEPNVPGVLVPEPSSVTLVVAGMLFLALLGRRRH